ncbi:hypothetical protein E3P96_01065 [Wallemia ichthyophaga]|nr:hypothetical protein E3P96_01065 [Wallemia ichthyophaga]
MTTTKLKEKEKARESESFEGFEGIEGMEGIDGMVEITRESYEESPIQPIVGEGVEADAEGDRQTPQAVAHPTNTNASSILSSTTLPNNIGGMSSYMDYKSNKDAKRLLHVILNDMDKKWDAKALMFKQVAKAQRRLRKKSEEECADIKHKYQNLISEYDTLHKTTEEDLNALRIHLEEAENALHESHTAHAETLSHLNETHREELEQLALNHHTLDKEVRELRDKHSEYLDTIYHLDQSRINAETRAEELESEVGVVKGECDEAIRECEQIHMTLSTATQQLREKDDTIASLKTSGDVLKLLDNFHPITALLSLAVVYLAACVIGLAADPIKIAKIGMGWD